MGRPEMPNGPRGDEIRLFAAPSFAAIARPQFRASPLEPNESRDRRRRDVRSPDDRPLHFPQRRCQAGTVLCAQRPRATHAREPDGLALILPPALAGPFHHPPIEVAIRRQERPDTFPLASPHDSSAAESNRSDRTARRQPAADSNHSPTSSGRQREFRGHLNKAAKSYERQTRRRNKRRDFRELFLPRR